LIDGFALGMAEEMGSSSTWLIKGGALLLDAVFLALFVLFGRLALGNRKVYLAGMIIYALDSLIPLVFGDYIGFGFHLLILYWLYQGFQAQRRMVTDQQLATQQ
jgi:MFS family permease